MSSHRSFNPLHGDDELGNEFETQDLESTSAPHSHHGSNKDVGKESHEPSHKSSGGDHGASHDPHHVAVAPTRVPAWIGDIVEHVFKVRKRNTTIEMEIYTGMVQFISCLYVLPVVPFQMQRCGYDAYSSIIATAVTCSIGCILGAFVTDMPLIVAPPTSVSIFFAVTMQQGGMSFPQGNLSLLITGAALAFLGICPPVGRFFTRLIPDGLQAAISVGIGLITALAGATEVNLVIRGKYTILDMGPPTLEVVIALTALIIVATLLHFHVKGAFCMGLIVGTLLWWMFTGEVPEALVTDPSTHNESGEGTGSKIVLLVFNLFFLFILTLNGLARSLSDLAGLTKKSGAIPRGSLLFIVCGVTTMLSGYFSGPPILLSPETAAGIKAGARTGLSTLVCGILFGISTFFSPVFAAVPAAGTAPLLIMVGVMMFGNSKRVDWADYKIAVPAYCVLFFIPFTYSILRGVVIGYIMYIMIGLFTGDMIQNVIDFVTDYRKPWELFQKKKPLAAEAEGSVMDDHDNDPNYVPPHSNTTIGRVFNDIGKFMDSMETEQGGITTITQM